MNDSHGQAGMSLVELMIGIALGLLVIAGAISIFVSSKQGFRAQDSAAQMQENARYSINYLAQLIRSADLWGGVRPAFITVGTHSISGPRSSKTCTGEWIANVKDGLHGYQGSAVPSIDCIAAADYLAQSDMIVIRRIDPNTFTTAEEITGKDKAHQNYVRARVGLDGYLYQGNQYAEADQHIANGDGVMNYQYDFQLLFLRRCVIKNGSTCGPQNTTPTLTSLQLQSDGGLSQVALVQNVEQMKFEYGVDSNNDLAVDIYQKAIHISDWNKVLAVRAYIVVRGDVLDYFKDKQTYAMGSDFCHGPAISSCQSKYSNYEGYQRRLVIKDILIRNRVQQ